MKTLSSTLKKGSAVLMLLGLFITTTQAQGNRGRQNGDNNRRSDGGTRQSTFRDRIAHDRNNNSGSVEHQRPTLPSRSDNNNRDFRNITRDRIDNANANRPNRGIINGDLNRRNRPADVAQNSNRGNSNWNNRPGNDNNRGNSWGNRPGNNDNRGRGNDWNRGNNNNNRGNGWNNNNRHSSYGGYYGGRYHRPVYNPRNPSWRYSYLPRRYSTFNTLPSTYLSINFGGYGYRYYDGVFYRPYNNIFTVIAPPIGIHINILPVGYRRIYVGDYPYYYYNGTYYDYQDNEYVVVSPPVGAIVESIPDGYETVVVDGETYYTVDGAQYKPVVQENGEIWYEVIKAN